MISAHGYAAPKAKGRFRPFDFKRRSPGPDDIVVDILFCGVCHSDIHSVRDEWGGGEYPMVPGHEILGRVSAVGKRVKRFRVGHLAGVGCFVASCGRCPSCKRGEQQFCPDIVFTYNGRATDGAPTTYGGYSDRIVVSQDFAFRIRAGQPLERVAPLLCAGITTYSPLKRAGVGRGSTVGIIGLGGLGHMGVKIAAALGAHVTVFTTSAKKVRDAKRLGAKDVVVTKKPNAFRKTVGRFDFILDTVSASHPIDPYLAALKVGGAMVKVGAPEKPLEVNAFSLIMGRKTLGGSLIGGLRETQEMLDFCAAKKIFSDVEVISPKEIDRAYDRAVAGDVKFRFVIDMGKDAEARK